MYIGSLKNRFSSEVSLVFLSKIKSISLEDSHSLGKMGTILFSASLNKLSKSQQGSCLCSLGALKQ